jgi:hypothetical protein
MPQRPEAAEAQKAPNAQEHEAQQAVANMLADTNFSFAAHKRHNVVPRDCGPYQVANPYDGHCAGSYSPEVAAAIKACQAGADTPLHKSECIWDKGRFSGTSYAADEERIIRTQH